MLLPRPLLCVVFLLAGLVCAAGARAQADATYALGPGDTILIKVFGEEDLSMKLVIGDSGKLNYPFLGELQVSGITVKQLEALIATGLRGDYLLNPDVTVTMEGYRPFYVNGEVKKPGGYPYHPGLTLQKAIALAGGFTERASRTKIAVAPATDPNAEPRVMGLNDSIQPGDVITVDQSFF